MKTSQHDEVAQFDESIQDDEPPQYDGAQLVPLVTDADIEQRVSDLIGRANMRQLWLLFLDDASMQLPLLVPIDGLPAEPTREQTALVVTKLHELMLDIDAAAVVTVWERYGAPSLTPQDAAWARSLRECCDREGVRLRGMLLSHRAGVRWIAEDDYERSAG